MPPRPDYRPATTHADRGDEFFDRVDPAVFPKHVLRRRNQRWAVRVGLDTLTDAEWMAHSGAFEPLPGSFPQPLALRYHGHQFRSYNPDLGDGRGFLFAQIYDLKDGRLLALGTKGSGQAPWSRFGDGRQCLLPFSDKAALEGALMSFAAIPTRARFGGAAPPRPRAYER